MPQVRGHLPHATIRAKVYEPAALQGMPATFKSVDSRVPDFKGLKFHVANRRRGLHRLLVVRGRLPGRNKTRPTQGHQHASQAPLRVQERTTGISSSPCPNWTGARSRRRNCPATIHAAVVRVQRRVRGCGETPYVKMLSQLFGDRL